MFKCLVVAITVAGLAVPAAAQSIGDLGRALQQQVLPREGADPRQEERDRAIYEQGRNDSERARDQRRFENRRRDKLHGSAQRREDRYKHDRHRAEEERSEHEDQRPWRGRY